MVAALIKTIRPRQWIKNTFVLAPLVFARHLEDWRYDVRALFAALAFCALSGAVYAFNDVRDVAADREHPTKRNRPIAAGKLSERSAMIFAGCLAVGALAGCLVLDIRLAAFAALYLAQNVAYSVKLKQIAFLDVLLITSGFVLRVLAGAAAIDVPASGWLLLCTSLIAMFFGLGKRAHELAWATRSGGEAKTTRAALLGYKLPVVRVAMLVLAVATSAAYLAYTINPTTTAYFGTERLPYSTPFVVLGIVRYLGLALWWPRDEPPTDAMLKDPWFLLDLAAAGATVVWAIYA